MYYLQKKYLRGLVKKKVKETGWQGEVTLDKYYDSRKCSYTNIIKNKDRRNE
jgi:hypothetical protein